MVNKLTSIIGKYSGSRRLDSKGLEEPDQDNETTKEKWLSGRREIKVKARVKRMRNFVSDSADFDDLIVHMVGQSHIDCAWMWRYEQTRKKAIVTFRKAVDHANMFPESFCFALSEPILLDWVKEDDPALFEQIQDKVNSGNIELVGGSYVEPDCMMPSGESFIRQRLYGMRFYRDNFKILPKVEWFLDSFGYNRGLPQILTKSGAKYFWTTKLTWNLQTIFPFVNFWWQGPDGSKILTGHFHMGADAIISWKKFGVGHRLLKGNGRKVWDYTDDYSDLIDHVEEQNCPHVGFFFGLGDGGHGPTHKEVALANAQAQLKMFEWSSVERFFNELVKFSDKFPVWNDELYLENHRGCLSNHSAVKRHNRKFENLLTSLETLGVIVSISASEYKYPLEEIEKLWKITLKNQFHDVLPGSSIPEVYDDCWDDWQYQSGIIDNLISEVGKKLSITSENDNLETTATFYLFNPLSWERTSRLFIPAHILENDSSENDGWKPKPAKLNVLNEDHHEYVCQPVSAETDAWENAFPAGWWTVINLKPLSLTPVRLIIKEDPMDYSALTTSELKITNGFVYVKVDSTTGGVSEITVDNINKGENILQGNSSNLAQGFLDDNRMWPAWNLTPEYWNHPLDLSNEKDVQINISDNGPVFSTLEIRRILGTSPVIQKIKLFKDLPEIFFEFHSDWKKEHVMLKLLFSTATEADLAIADGAYARTLHKTEPVTPCDKARFEKVCHKFVDLSTPDDKWGIALLNEGKYAFDLSGGDIKLTLLRSCQYTPPAPEAWVNLERQLNEEQYGHKVPEFSGLGPFRCNYALFPHLGNASIYPEGTVNPLVRQKAEEFNNPIIIVPIGNQALSFEGNSSLESPFMEVEPSNVHLGALKWEEWKIENAIVMRFFESNGVESKARVKFYPAIAEKIKEMKSVDLLEREIDLKFEWDKNTGILEFYINKFEIITFKATIK